jgi:hypothetical protein
MNYDMKRVSGPYVNLPVCSWRATRTTTAGSPHVEMLSPSPEPATYACRSFSVNSHRCQTPPLFCLKSIVVNEQSKSLPSASWGIGYRNRDETFSRYGVAHFFLHRTSAPASLGSVTTIRKGTSTGAVLHSGSLLLDIYRGATSVTTAGHHQGPSRGIVSCIATPLLRRSLSLTGI